MIILLAALIVAAGLLAMGQTEWAAGLADGVVAANQQSLTAQYDAYVAAGAQPATGSGYVATAGNLARMLLIAAVVMGGSVLLDRRAARQRMAIN
jgi:hypothetical protein